MKKTLLTLIFILSFSFLCVSQQNTDYYEVNSNGLIVINESNVMTIDNQMTGTMVFPLSNPTNFYLVDSDGKILIRSEDTTLISFDSEELLPGHYHMILENQNNIEIYKLLR